jgi:hypothetical protein
MDQVVKPPTQNGGQPKDDGRRYLFSRAGIFWFDLIDLAVLFILGAWYVEFPDSVKLADSYKLPVESMWFGSLGGVIISLKGIYDHSGGADG